MADRCDYPGCGQAARLFAPTRRRCLAHADGQAPSLRSDVPRAPCPECGQPFANTVVTCLHLGHSVPEESVPAKCAERTCEQNEGYGCQGHTPRAPAPLPVGEAERRVWRTRVRVLLHREIDARHAAARMEARDAEVRRILTNWPADGAYALRVLRGET